jgi:hypothetical protein
MANPTGTGVGAGRLGHQHSRPTTRRISSYSIGEFLPYTINNTNTLSVFGPKIEVVAPSFGFKISGTGGSSM